MKQVSAIRFTSGYIRIYRGRTRHDYTPTWTSFRRLCSVIHRPDTMAFTYTSRSTWAVRISR